MRKNRQDSANLSRPDLLEVDMEHTSKWRHRMKIAPFLKEETSVELVDRACEYIVKRITKISELEKRWQDKEPDERDFFLRELEDVRDDFDELIGSNDLSTYELENEFNYRLDKLYELGDRRIRLKNGTTEKFIWVGAI